MKTRLDAELVRRGLARSREQAGDLIEKRSVLVAGIPATKPATQVDAETSITLTGERDDFVSRGGHKLAGALDAFPEIKVEGKRALDAGASTGGFSDVLLAHGRLERDPVSGKSGRERVVQKMQEADALILLHGNDEWCAEYIPSKFYDYLWSGRPIWGITHRNPQLDQMLLDRKSYLSADGNEEGIALALERIWLDWQQKQLLQPIWQPIGVDQAVSSILSHIAQEKVVS